MASLSFWIGVGVRRHQTDLTHSNYESIYIFEDEILELTLLPLSISMGMIWRMLVGLYEVNAALLLR